MSLQVSADKGPNEDDKGDCNSTEKHERFGVIHNKCVESVLLVFEILNQFFVCVFPAYLSKTDRRVSSSDAKNEANRDKEISKPCVQAEKEASTPIPSIPGTNSKKHQTAKKIASLVRNPSALKPKSQLKSSQSKNPKPSCLKR